MEMLTTVIRDSDNAQRIRMAQSKGLTVLRDGYAWTVQSFDGQTVVLTRSLPNTEPMIWFGSN